MPRPNGPATDDLDITVQAGEEGTTVHLSGRLNIESSPAFRDRLLALLGAHSAESVIVDLSGVTYIDSSGIATLIEALKIARQRQTALCLWGLQGPFLHLFEATGISALFEKSGCGPGASVSKVS